MLADQYITRVEKDLVSVLGKLDEVKTVAGMIVDAVLNGRRVFVSDKYGILDSELVNRAGSLALYRSLSAGTSALESGDIIIISAYHPADPFDLGVVSNAREIGCKTISITPPGELADSSDMALLNTFDPDNGIIDLQGIEKPFCPVNGILNAALAWMLTAEITELLVNSGKSPSVFVNESLKNGVETNTTARRSYTEKGY